MLWDESGSEDDDSSGSDSGETKLYEESISERLRNKTLVVKNGDNTYRCPLSPGRKKQSYKYQDLLDHARSFARGKKGPRKTGGHRAVMKYLLEGLGEKPVVPQVERQLHLDQIAPNRKDQAIRPLAPWVGILVNIDNSRTDKHGFKLAPGSAEIKDKFQEYKPERVDVFHDYRGHQGTALLTFRNDMHGLEDAQAFDQSFAVSNHGQKAWWDESRPLNRDLYGWQATEKDLEANLGCLTKFIKNYCEVKTVKDVVEENERMNKQFVEFLVKITDRKNDMMKTTHSQFVTLQNMEAEIEALRLKVEEEKRNAESQHKRDLEEIILQEQKKATAHNEIVALTNKLRMLKSRCEQMRDDVLKLRLSNESLRLQYEKEREMAQRMLKEAGKQVVLHAAMRCKLTVEQKELLKKQEDENMNLDISVRMKNTKLMEMQQLELQKHHVKELLELEKLKESDKAKIAELEAELEMNEVMVNALFTKERTANEQLEEARKVALELLHTYGDETTVGIKYAGSINKTPWIAAGKKKHYPDGYQWAMSKMISEWEERLRDPKYHPFTTVDVGAGNWKRTINEDDKFLKELKKNLGAEVLLSVTTALMEMEEYNASGRFVVAIGWDFRKNQRVLLKDVLLHLKELLESARFKVGAKKKRILEY